MQSEIFLLTLYFNLFNTKRTLLYISNQTVRDLNAFHQGYKNQSVNDVTAKVAVCSETHTKHSTLSEYRVELLNITLRLPN
jgi:hypothetical protein